MADELTVAANSTDTSVIVPTTTSTLPDQLPQAIAPNNPPTSPALTTIRNISQTAQEREIIKRKMVMSQVENSLEGCYCHEVIGDTVLDKNRLIGSSQEHLCQR